MNRFYGAVGYGESREIPENSGIYVNVITERKYYGDISRNMVQTEKGENLNDNIKVNNSISIVADDYAYQHFFDIKYVNWAGTLWTITSVEVKSPRLILYLGSVYNGPTG